MKIKPCFFTEFMLAEVFYALLFSILKIAVIMF